MKYVEAGWLGRKVERGFYDLFGRASGADALTLRPRNRSAVFQRTGLGQRRIERRQVLFQFADRAGIVVQS